MDTTAQETELDFFKSTGEIFGRLRIGLQCENIDDFRRVSANPFARNKLERAAHDAWNKGFSIGYSKPKLKKGETFTINHISGQEAFVCLDDIEIGDPVVVLHSFHGLLASGYKPDENDGKIIIGNVRAINGKLSGICRTNDFAHISIRNHQLGAWSSNLVLRFVG